MKQLPKTIALFILVPLFAFAKAEWVRQPINSKVSVLFPVKPDRVELSNGSVVWRYANDISVCMVAQVDLVKMGMDSASIKEMLEKPESLQEFRDGIIGEMKGSKLVAEAQSVLNGYPSYDIVLDVSSSQATADKDIMHTKSVFVGTALYSLYYHEKKGKLQEAERKQFFSSFMVAK